MLRPLLIIGVGGSGGKTIRSIKETLLRRLQEHDWPKDRPLPPNWQFLQIDTAYDGQEFPAPMLPPDEVCVVVKETDTFANLRSELEALGNNEEERARLLSGWGIHDFAGNLGRGAGMIRGVGRQAGVARANLIAKSLKTSVDKMKSANKTELQSVANALGYDPVTSVSPDTEVLLITSLSGGSGAGMFIDVAEILKRQHANEKWVGHITSILYTAEVFEGLAAAGAVNQNSLGAMNELVAGFYQAPTDRTDLLMKRLGLPDVSAPEHDHTGSRVNVLIGPRNRNGVDISQDSRGSGMDEVFLTIGETLGNLFLEPKMSEYFYNQALVNTAAKDSVKDESGMSPVSLPNGAEPVMPFFSIGFGRLSLGVDRVTDYVTDSLTYHQMKTLRFPDLHQITTGQNPTELVEERVKEIWESGFLRQLKLDEAGLNANDVTDAFKYSEIDVLAKRFATDVLQPLASSASPQPTPTIANRTWVEWESRQDEYLLKIQKEVRLKAKKWVEFIQNHIVDIVAEQLAISGFKVTTGLLRKTISELDEVWKTDLANEVQAEQKSILGVNQTWWASSVREKAGGKQGLSQSDRQVYESAEKTIMAWLTKIESIERKSLAINMLADLQENFLSRLLKFLAENDQVLQDKSSSTKPEDNQGILLSRLPEWGKPVPRAYRPRAIEQTLIEPEDFKDFYLENAKLDLESDRQSSTWEISVQESLLGRPLHNPEPVQLQQLLGLTTRWSPKTALAPTDQPSLPRFTINVGLAVQRKNNRDWLLSKSRYYDQHKVSIRDYVLDENEITKSKREEDFVAKAGRMIQMSAPLMQLNQNALKSLKILDQDEVHSPEGTLKDSAKLPFGPSDDIFNQLKAMLVSNGVDTSKPSFESDWFDASSKETQLYAITVPEGPMPAYAFSSLTSPIASSVRAAATTAATWSTYFARRRTRPLLESIPLTQEMRRSLITGWLIAKAFDLVNQKPEATVGLELEIWNPTTFGSPSFSKFPSPLLSVSKVDSRRDYHLGSVLVSLGLAMVEYGETGRDECLHAYRFLKFLGREVTASAEIGVDNWDFPEAGGDRLPSGEHGICSLLADWLLNGNGDNLKAPNRGGLASQSYPSLEARSKALSDYLVGQQTVLQSIWNEVKQKSISVGTSGWTEYPALWELREEIDDCLNDIKRFAQIKIDNQVSPSIRINI